MKVLGFFCVATLVASCADDGGSHGNYRHGDGATSLMSTSLAASAAAKKKMAASLDSSGDEHSRYYYLTPSNVTGKILTAMMMVGVMGGDGPGASAVELIYPENTDHRTIQKLGTTSILHDFNFLEPLTSTYAFTCCSDHYPPDEDARIASIEMLFGYIDLSFTIPQGALAGEHQVRIVYITIDDMGVKQGDVLYKDGTAWKWWNTDSASPGLAATRPASPQQNVFALTSHSVDSRGNQYLSTIWSYVPDSITTLFPQTGIFDSSWSFKVDFDVSNGVLFRYKHPATLASIGDMLSCIDINADIRDRPAWAIAAKVTVTSNGAIPGSQE